MERSRDVRNLKLALGLIVVFMAGEITVAIAAGSLALLSDAAHMLTDAAALALALVAARLASRPARGSMTFGLGRAEILSAQANGMTMLVLALLIVYGAIAHLISPPAVQGVPVLCVALVGIVVNLAATRLLGGEHPGHSHAGAGSGPQGHLHGGAFPEAHGHSHGHGPHGHDHAHTAPSSAVAADAAAAGAAAAAAGAAGAAGAAAAGANAAAAAAAPKRSLNIEGSYQHLLTDLFGFTATAAAAAVIILTGFDRADAIASLLIAAIMLRSAAMLLKASARVIMEAAPDELDPDEIGYLMASQPGVVEVHDLHVWEVTAGFPTVSAHIVVDCGHDCHEVRQALSQLLADRFGLEHSTLQVEHTQARQDPLQIEVLGN